MAFEGDLKNLPLADVLQTIHQNNLTGTLYVRDNHGERRVAFSQGHIVAFQPAPEDAHLVIDTLAKRRIVSKTEANKARTGFLGKRKNLRAALAARGLVKEDDYKKAVKEDLLEGVYDLFLETDRTFKFQDGAPDLASFDQDQVAAECRLAPPGIVMEGARRVDEWARIRRAIGSFHEVLVRDGDLQEDDDAVVKEIWKLADGARDLTAVLEALPVARFRGCEAVAALVSARRLRPASAQEYVALGTKAEERGSFEEAASYYEQGLATERGNLSLRSRRAAALERAGRQQDAADERKLLAAALLDQGKRHDAAAELTRAADLAPRDPVPLERRLQLAQEDQDRDIARVTAARLAALYEDLGLADKARDLLRAQVTRAPEEDELREKLADLLVRQGDQKGAAREWNETAGRAARGGNLAVAAARLRRALEVDPGDEKARALLHDIESGEITARRARRRQRIRVAVGSLVLFGAAGWILWEVMALERFQEVQLTTDGHPGVYRKIALGTPEAVEEALESLLAVREVYPYATLAAWQVNETSKELVSIYAQAFERAFKEPFLLPPAQKILSDAEVLKRLAELVDGTEQDSLEQIVRSGDEALETDPAQARAHYQKASMRILEARNLLAHGSRSLRDRDEVLALVHRIEPCSKRAIAGRVRSLPLSKEARELLQKTVLDTLPGIAPQDPKH